FRVPLPSASAAARDYDRDPPVESGSGIVEEKTMGKGRLEAFSDGVIAILITIMVLELKVPHGAGWDALRPLTAVFLTYVLSFVYLGIYWNNHHHMLHAAERINGKVLWANLHLLFWLSLVPFVTGWMGENHFAPLPTAVSAGHALVELCQRQQLPFLEGPGHDREAHGQGAAAESTRHGDGRQPAKRGHPADGVRPLHALQALVGGRSGHHLGGRHEQVEVREDLGHGLLAERADA